MRTRERERDREKNLNVDDYSWRLHGDLRVIVRGIKRGKFGDEEDRIE